MSTPHLHIERLAELIDEVPTPLEREHLAGCPLCTAELAAYRQVVSMAGDERRHIAPPMTDWESLRTSLIAEGLITAPGTTRRRRGPGLWLQRVAGVALLLATGTVAGRVSAGVPLPEAVSFRGRSEVGAGTPAANASNAISTPADAMAQLQQAQRAYDEAAAWLTANDTTSSSGSSDQYRTRLAALDMASETFQRALTDAPEDPILNQYFMATMNAREVAIRRLGTTVPVGVRVGRF
jgi:hypothetical protein